MNITILYNEPTLPPDHPDYDQEAGVIESVEAFAAALDDAGHDYRPLGLRDSVGPLVEHVAAARPDVIVNLCEGFAGCTSGEVHIASLLELLGVPYTGSPPECLAIEHNKARTKWLLRGAGLPTAPAVCVSPGQPLPRELLDDWLAGGPLFVKPAAEDASLGIDHESVVSDWGALERQVGHVAERFGDVLIERYLDGREFNIAIVGLREPQVLPLAEVEFRAAAPGQWPIVTYQAKWDPNGPEDRATPVRCPAVVEPELARAVSEAALGAFRLLGCRDYARVDLRTDRAGQVFILEVNGNPDAGPRAGFVRTLLAGGISYNEFVRRLVATAAGRARR